MDSATILFFKCQRWDNTILTEKMEELFITKIKGELPHRSPQSQYDFSNYTSFVPYVTSYNTLLRSSGYFISGFHF